MQKEYFEETPLSEVLLENKRRLEQTASTYDPVAGDINDGERFQLKKLSGEIIMLPASMRQERIIEELQYICKLENRDSQSIGRYQELLKKLDEVRCRHDFPYWAATRARIKAKGGGEDILFVLNPPQRKLVRKLEEMRLASEPIRLVLLKARQWGGSTCVQLYMAWLQMIMEKGLNSLIVAHYNNAADEIKDMLDRMLSQYYVQTDDEGEIEYIPVKTRRVGGSGRTMRIVERNCKVKVATAESPDACRGGDYNLIHCSEVGLWKATRLKTPEQILRSACSGVLYKPMTMIVYESTANGTGTFFHREYEAAKRGTSQFKPLFVAWYEIPQYSLEFKKGSREEFAGKLIEKRNETQSQDPRQPSGAYLWTLWKRGATLEALNWYVHERSKYNNSELMAAEYPSDDIEAFVHSGANVFDKYKVETFREFCRMPFERGEIEGVCFSGPDSLREVRFVPSSSGSLKVWKKPDPEGTISVRDRYVAVVDIGGRSESSDWSVVAVFDRLPMLKGEGPEVVAQWRGHSDFDLLAWNAARIATFYENALLVIESNTLETRSSAAMVEGDQSLFILNELKKSYRNLYARRQSEEAVRQGLPARYGFHTNMATKPMIISMLVRAVREKAFIEREELCLDELLTYEKKANGSYGAIEGHHDDMVITRAIGLHICFNEMPMPEIEAQKDYSYKLWNWRRPATEATF